jgi:hypothetical protein
VSNVSVDYFELREAQVLRGFVYPQNQSTACPPFSKALPGCHYCQNCPSQTGGAADVLDSLTFIWLRKKTGAPQKKACQCVCGPSGLSRIKSAISVVLMWHLGPQGGAETILY